MDEDVLWLDIPVEDALLIEILAALDHLEEQTESLGLGKAALLLDEGV